MLLCINHLISYTHTHTQCICAHRETCIHLHFVFFSLHGTVFKALFYQCYMPLERSSLYLDSMFSHLYSGDRAAEKPKRNNKWLALVLSVTTPRMIVLILAFIKFIASLYEAIRWSQTTVDLVTTENCKTR